MKSYFKEHEKFYAAVQDVISTCKDLDIQIKAVDNLEKAWNNFSTETDIDKEVHSFYEGKTN